MTIRKPGVSQAAWVFASIASTAALGQTAPEPNAEAVEVDEIIVTGSRIARSDFSSTSPIVTYGEEAIAQSGTVNIEQAMNQLPQFVQGQTSSTVGAVALAGRASLNLRGPRSKQEISCCSTAGVCRCRTRMPSSTST
jgi:hypothetical protein